MGRPDEQRSAFASLGYTQRTKPEGQKGPCRNLLRLSNADHIELKTLRLPRSQDGQRCARLVVDQPVRERPASSTTARASSNRASGTISASDRSSELAVNRRQRLEHEVLVSLKQNHRRRLALPNRRRSFQRRSDPWNQHRRELRYPTWNAIADRHLGEFDLAKRGSDLRPRLGWIRASRLGKIAEERDRAVRNSPRNRSQLHGGEILGLIDDDVLETLRSITPDEELKLVEQRRASDRK